MPGTILVVFDDLFKLEEVGTALQDKGYNVLLAYNNDSAVKNLIEEDVDLMITCLKVPDKGDLHLIEYSRKMVKYRNLPVVLIADLAEKQDIEKAEKFGAVCLATEQADVNKIVKTACEQFKKKNSREKKDSSGSTGGMAALSLIIVDDETDLVNVLKNFLTPLFKNVYTANSVEDAVKLCTEKPVDLLISDIKMGSKTGFQLVDWINEFPDTAGIPVVMITGVGKDLVSVKKAKSLLIDKYLIKPFGLETLRATIFEVCGDAYRQEKLKRFLNLFSREYDTSQEEEQNQLLNIRNQILAFKRKQNLNRRQVKLLPKGTSEEKRLELENKAESFRLEAKNLQSSITEIKRAFSTRRKELVQIKRGIQKRLDAVKK